LGTIAAFVALQYTRVPANGETIRAFYEAGANDLMEVMFADIDRARASLASYERRTGEKSSVSAESMLEAVQGKHLKAVATEMPFLHSVVTHTDFLKGILLSGLADTNRSTTGGVHPVRQSRHRGSAAAFYRSWNQNPRHLYLRTFD
jgi:hypothetical protein